MQQVRVEGASVDKGVAADGSDAESAAVRRASGRSRKVKRQHTRLHTRPVEAPPERESDHVLLATLPLVWLLAGALWWLLAWPPPFGRSVAVGRVDRMCGSRMISKRADRRRPDSVGDRTRRNGKKNHTTIRMRRSQRNTLMRAGRCDPRALGCPLISDAKNTDPNCKSAGKQTGKCTLCL